MNKKKFILLDRDGVINQDSCSFIKKPEEWQPIKGSLEAIALLHQQGFKIIVITNQSGLGRGFFNTETLQQIHTKMYRLVEDQGGKIDGVYYCPHKPDEGCGCRKPKPGLLNKFSREKSVHLDRIPFIGDSFRDIQAGMAVGAEPMLVKTGKGKATLSEFPGLNIPVFEDLHAAAQFIISR